MNGIKKIMHILGIIVTGLDFYGSVLMQYFTAKRNNEKDEHK